VQDWWDDLRGAAAQGASVMATPLTMNACERKYLRSLNVQVGVRRVSRAAFKDLVRNCTAEGLERYIRTVRRGYDDMTEGSKA
jgi:hypothetical protein